MTLLSCLIYYFTLRFVNFVSSDSRSLEVIERKSSRVLSTTDEEGRSQSENAIRQVTDQIGEANLISWKPNSTSEKNGKMDPV